MFGPRCGAMGRVRTEHRLTCCHHGLQVPSVAELLAFCDVGIVPVLPAERGGRGALLVFTLRACEAWNFWRFRASKGTV